VDYALLRCAWRCCAEIEEIRTHQHNPVIYPEAVLRGVLLLLVRPFAPLEERKEGILARLMAVPEYLEGARENLKRVPALYREIAYEVNAGGLAFVDEVLRVMLKSFPGEAERIEHAGERARIGLLQYQEFLDRDLGSSVGGSFAIGERWMNFRLEREHLLSMDCAYLEKFGREHMARAKSLLEAEANRLDSTRLPGGSRSRMRSAGIRNRCACATPTSPRWSARNGS
jgi:hypothetical protein